MATRVLPGVYVSLNDMSQLPEGATSLNVGYVVAAKRGPVNEFRVVTSPTDFLNTYTFSGAPSVSDDPTFHSVLKVLAQTNTMYIVRAANNPLYGGVVIKKAKDYGKITAISAENETITIEGDDTPFIGDIVMVTGTGVADGYYIVKSVAGNVITVTGNITEDYTGTSDSAKLIKAPVSPLSAQKIANIAGVNVTEKTFRLEGNVASRFTVNQIITVKGASETGYASNNGDFTVVSSTFNLEANETEVQVKEALVEGSDGVIYQNSLVSPEGYAFQEDDLMLITGINPGAYNGKLAFLIVSSVDNSDDLTYYPGADIGGTPCTFGTMRLDVVNTETNEILESFTFSRDNSARAIDGTSLYVDNIVEGSAYIKVNNNEANTDLPNSTLGGTPIQASGGSDGGLVDETVLTKALDVFADKTIPISILGNGCSAGAETSVFQTSLIELANTRKDCLVFVNSRKSDETATFPSARAQNIVDYKKKTLASTSFYGCMYAPHVKTVDSFNQRQVDIGSDAVAIAGWLNVINNLNYPYAYAGPQNGLVNGVTCDWKIGDISGEAELLNDASINYVAYDGKVGRYYMQCQNTLQIANSAMRNIGTVLNVLDIKENLATSLKEYLQLPITDLLRADILNTCNDYLAPMVGVRFYRYSFQDVSSDTDISNNTLRYLLIIQPTAYSQRIYVTMNIVNSSFDFTIIQSA